MITIAGDTVIDIVSKFNYINPDINIPFVIVSYGISETEENNILSCIQYSSSVLYYKSERFHRFLDFPYSTSVLVVGSFSYKDIIDVSEKFETTYLGVVSEKVIDTTTTRFKSSVFNNTMSLLLGIILCGLFDYKVSLCLVACYVAFSFLTLKFKK